MNLLESNSIYDSKTKKLIIMSENETVTIIGTEAVILNKRRVTHINLTDMGFELKTYPDDSEKIEWYELVLVPGSKYYDPLLLCYNPELDEFYFDPYDHIRIRGIEWAEKIINAFMGVKIMD